jgi:hypothetical protein
MDSFIVRALVTMVVSVAGLLVLCELAWLFSRVLERYQHWREVRHYERSCHELRLLEERMISWREKNCGRSVDETEH